MKLVKKFPAFHGTRRFITALTSVRQLSLSSASPIQSIYPHPNSWRSILVLSTHLRLGLPNGLLPSGFPQQDPIHPSLLTHTRNMPNPSQEYKSFSSSLCSLLLPLVTSSFNDTYSYHNAFFCSGEVFFRKTKYLLYDQY